MQKSTNNENLYDDIPDGLKSFPQWVTWRPQPKTKPQPDGKVDKIPVNPRTGGNASVSEPATWGTFQDVARYERKGFVFTEKDPHVGIDLDGCRNPETGEIAEWALDVIRRFPHWYWERSPSGTGVHGIGKGTLPPGGRKRGQIEVYDRGRFFTVTGDYVAGTTLDLEDHTAELAAWHATVFGESTNARKKTHARAKNSQHDMGRVQHALAHIPAHDYDVWLRVGMALHDAGEEHFSYWVEWSRTCPEKFDADVCHKKWASFSAERDSAVTVATIIQLAKERGWTPSRNGHAQHAEPAPAPDWSDATASARRTTAEQTELSIGTASFNLTDLGNGERLIARHGQNLHYCTPWRKWLAWDGKRWHVDTTQQVRQWARETVRAIYTEAAGMANETDRKLIARHAVRSEAEARIDALISLAQMDCPVLPEHLDQDPWLLNVQNGTLDLHTGELRSHQREDLLTKLVLVAYDSAASCPTWEAFLERILAGRQDVIDFLQRAIGYSLTGDTSEQCLFLLYGIGANGKSTCLEVVHKLLGDYAERAEFSTFLHKDRDSVRNDLAKLRGARFVAAGEVDEGRRLAESLVKSLTGEDTVSARFLFGEFFDFRPQFKLFLAANHLPVIRGTDYAIWRRIRVIPFIVTIPVEEQDRTLPAKLKAELSGILAWAVRGCLAWQQEGRLIEPEAVRAATTAYQTEMDTLAAFIEECCLIKAGSQVKAGDLLTAYQRWSGDSKMTYQKLVRRLTDRGFERGRSTITGHMTWRGIGLLAPEEARD